MNCNLLFGVSRAVAVLLILHLLTACGSISQQVRIVQGTDTDWQKVEPGPLDPVQIDLNRQDKSIFSMRLTREEVEREYQYDRNFKEYRETKQPDLFHILVLGPLTVWVTCIVDSHECFGYTREWRRADKSDQKWIHPEDRVGKRDTGRSRSRTVSYSDAWTTRFTLNALDGNGVVTDVVEVEQSGRGSQSRINVAEMATRLKVKPVSMRLSVQGIRPPSNMAQETLDARATAELNLFNERWYSVDQLYAMYTESLKQNLKGGRNKEALSDFERLETLGKPLPESFNYFYGSTLIKSGARDRGQDYLRRYLKVAGKDGVYAEQAQELLK